MLQKIYLAPDAQASDYTFDSELIAFNSTNPKLKLNRPASLLIFSLFNESAALNYSRDGGVLPATAHGTAAITDGALLLDSGHWVEYAGAGNITAAIQQGSIQFRRAPNYSGVPSSRLVLFSILRSFGNYRNLIELDHDADGHLKLYIFDKDQNGIMSADLGAWSPTSGTFYLMAVEFNISLGATRLFIDGVQFGATQTATGLRDSNIGLLYIGRAWDTSLKDESYVDGFEIYDTAQHTADYTPTAFTDYVSTSPSIQAATVNASRIISLAANADKPEGTDVRFTLKVAGVEYWFNGDAWAESTGPEESNAEITGEQLALLDLSGLTSVAPVFYLLSDGDYTPQLFSYILQYLGYGVATVTGCFLKANGELAKSGRVRARPVLLAALPSTNAQVGTSSVSAEAGEFGVWTMDLISGIEYKFTFESMQDGRRIQDGSINAMVPEPGPVLFGSLVDS